MFAPVSVPGLLLLAAAPQEPPDVAREWRAREWALFGAERGAEPVADRGADLAAALTSPDWSERHLALDALARTPDSAALGLAAHGLAVDAALEDEHPNVRAAALGVYAAAGAGLPSVSLELARDPFASESRALADALARAEPTPAGRSTLLALARGAGEGAAVARRGLLSWGPQAAREQLALLTPQGALDGDGLLAALPHLRRAPVAPTLVEGLRARAGTDPAHGTLVEALALHAELDGGQGAPRCDRARLVAGWLAFRPGDYRHEVAWRERTLELAREGDETLGRLLVQAAAELFGDAPSPRFPDHARQADAAYGDRELAAAFLVECAAEALETGLAIELSAQLPEALAGEIWARIAPRVERVERAGAARWLAPEVSDELRFGVASVLAEVFGRSGDATAEELLFGLLEDTDSGLRRASFRWLCAEPHLAARLPALHDAWSRYDAEERTLHLRSLPRDTCPVPFQADLLALCARRDRRVGALLELLGTFEDDPAVQGALRTWLEEELRGLERARDHDTWRVHEARAEALLRALGPRALRELEGTLVRTLAAPPPLVTGQRHDPQLTKLCCALLGRSAAGRDRLAGHLRVGVENRARLEAAIQVLVADDPREAHPAALRALVDGYARCDSELGVRVLAALGRGSDPAGEALLRDCVRDPRQGLERRQAAVEALARRDAEAVLVAELATLEDPEVRSALAQALALRSTSGARVALRSAWESTRERVGTPAERPADAHLEGEFLVALLVAGGLERSERRQVLAAPLAWAARDAATRFRGERTAATGFRWRAELRAARFLTARGELGDFLAASGSWWRLDGDLLLALARAARAGGERAWARRLFEAAAVATAGEVTSDGWWNRRAEIALSRLELAAEAQDAEALARASAWLWADLRLVERRIAKVEERLGSFDRRAGVDPAANLDAGRLQAQAWAALGAGQAEAARALSARAETRLGASRGAREGQAALVRALRD